MSQTPSEPRKRRLRRIVKWTTLSVAAVVLLLASYVALWCCYVCGEVIPSAVQSRIPLRLFDPIDEYVVSTLPGSDLLYTLTEWSGGCGEESWDYCHDWMRCNKYGDCDAWERYH